MNRSFSQFKATREAGAYNRKGFSVTRLTSLNNQGGYKQDFTIIVMYGSMQSYLILARCTPPQLSPSPFHLYSFL